MQQIYRKCLMADHQLNEIEYVCLYPQCQSSRFLCSKCAQENNHKHNQENNSHIVVDRDFYDQIKNNLNKAKSQQQEKNDDMLKLLDLIKQILQDMQNLLNVLNIINLLNKVNNRISIQIVWRILNGQDNGFNKIDDQSLNNLINMMNILKILTFIRN